VRAITRIADANNEDYLLMIADHGTAHHVEKLVSKFRTAKRLQDVDIVRAQYNNREVTHYYDDAGCLVIKARLPAEQGALIVKALEMAMDAQFHDANVTAVTSDPDSESETEPTPIAARRADALTEIAETYMNNNESSGSTADRYQVVVHVSAVTPKTIGAASGRDSYIEDGPGVTAVTSRRIACDSSAKVVAFRAVPIRDLSMDTTLNTGRMAVIRVWITWSCSADTIITWCMRVALLVARMRTVGSYSKTNESSHSISHQDYRV